MKHKELIFTGIIECPVPGCKRGFYTGLWKEYQTVICPEHRKHFCSVLEDKKGNKYRVVDNFGDTEG